MQPYPGDNKRIQSVSRATRLFIVALFGMMLWRLAGDYRQYQMQMLFDTADQALKQDNLPRASELFDSLLESQPDKPLLFRAIIGHCEDNEKYDLGLKYARRALQACKNASKAEKAGLYDTLAQALSEAKQGNYQQEALQAADEALQLAPNAPEALNAKGYMLADFNQNLDQAEELTTRALKLLAAMPDSDPQKAELTAVTEDSYGWVLYRKEKYAEALDAFNQAVEDTPEEAQTASARKVYAYHQGATYCKLGRFEEARRALQAALQYDPAYEEASALLKELPPPVSPSPQEAPATPPAKPVPHDEKTVSTNPKSA